MKESTMYPVFRHAFNYYWRTYGNISYHKDPDTWMWSRMGYDSFVVNPAGKHIAIEFKICHNKNYFNFTTLFANAEHELKNLAHIAKLSGLAWVIIKFSEYKGKIKYYPINFIMNNLDTRIDIEWWYWSEFKKIKTDVQSVLDISPLLW